MNVTRRAAMAVLAAAPLAVAGPVAATGIADSTIEELFARWWALYAADYRNETADEAIAQYEEYRRLVVQITALVPVTAQDLAMQIIAETDNGDSVWTDEFESDVRTLASANDIAVCSASEVTRKIRSAS